MKYNTTWSLYSFVCTLHHLIITITQAHLKVVNFLNACRVHSAQCVSKIKSVLSFIIPPPHRRWNVGILDSPRCLSVRPSVCRQGFRNFLKKLLAQFISNLAFTLMGWVCWPLYIFVFLASFSALWWPNIWSKIGFLEFKKKQLWVPFLTYLAFTLMGWVSWPLFIFVFLAPIEIIVGYFWMRWLVIRAWVYCPHLWTLLVFHAIYGAVCEFTLQIDLMIIVRVRVLYFIITIKSEVGPICHCLGLGHETVVCAEWFSIYLFFLAYFNFYDNVNSL